MAEYLRIADKRRLQTPVHHYQHPESGRQVTLVAPWHFGDRRYYLELREVIGEREDAGAVVHCEGSDRVADDSAVIAEELILLRDRRDCRDLKIARFPTLGWVHQYAGLEPQPHWEIHDLSSLAIIRLAGRSVIAQQVAVTRRYFGPPKRTTALKRLRAELTIGMRVMASRSAQRRNRLGYVVFADLRTPVALDAFNATRRDTVMVWGVPHVPYLDAGIRAAGLTHTGTDWHTVTRIPSLWSLPRKPPTTTPQQPAAPAWPGNPRSVR